MKRLIYGICALAAAIGLAACEESVRIELTAPEDRMHLSADKELVEISFFEPEAVAQTFRWGNCGFEAEGVPYNIYFKMDISGNDFETSIDKIDVTGRNEISFTGLELKKFLSAWKIMDGTKVKIQAEVIAQAAETESVETQKYRLPEVSKTEFDMVDNNKVELVIGDKSYVFVSDCIYLLISEPGDFYCTAGGNSRMEVKVPAKGLWRFDFSFEERKVKAVRPPMWLLGDACSNGWSIPTMPRFSDNEDGSVKTWEGLLSKGEMKFALEINDEWNFNIPYIMPYSGGAAPENAPVQFVPNGSPDNKWYVSQMGEYRITVNLEEMNVSFDLLKTYELKWDNIWMVGSATTGGWNSQPFQIKLNYDSSNSITGYPGVFWFEGPLTEGEFKFPLEERSFEVPYLMPLNVDSDGLQQLPGNGESCEIEYVPRYGYDHKWKVSADQAGEYKLIVDTDKMTMTVMKK